MADNVMVTLKSDSNQALGLGQYAIDFMANGSPSASVIQRIELFHTDACLCGLSALALGTNAPVVLRNEALTYAMDAGATVFGSSVKVAPEKAVAANASAVREWDSNGTNFGYNPSLGHTAGEFGHNDFYPVAIAAAQMAGKDGATAVKAMILCDEIRGRLAEVFSLKTYKVDHVVHGAIASAATYGAMMGATAEQIESAIGMVVAHAIPFRAIRAGKQLSDSKGASAAISTEFAVLSMKRSMAGFVGPKDIFRNPESIFRIFEGPGQMFKAVNATDANTAPGDASPFDLVLGMSGDDFAVMGMHFKLGLYEHQSAGAIQAVVDAISAKPEILDGDAPSGAITAMKVVAYEPAFGIIGDPAKRNPTTRQSADHSMVYILSTLIRKAIELRKAGSFSAWAERDTLWKALMLAPCDYNSDAVSNAQTRAIMDTISFEHGGKEYDDRYPDGIPTSVVIDAAGESIDSGLVMYPIGHARHETFSREDMLATKFEMLGSLVSGNKDAIVDRYSNIATKSADEIKTLNDFDLTIGAPFD